MPSYGFPAKSTYSVQATANEFTVTGLGWRNLNIVGGTLNQEVKTKSSEFISTITVKPVVVGATVKASGEAGYRIKWTGNQPPVVALSLISDATATFRGYAGRMKTTGFTKNVSADAARDPEMRNATLSLSKGTRSVALVKNSQDVYAADVWISTGTIEVTRTSSSEPFDAYIAVSLSAPPRTASSQARKSNP